MLQSPTIPQKATSIYFKSFEVESSVAIEMNCNLLENIHSYIVILCGQTVLHRTLLLFHWKSFMVTNQSVKIVKLFHLEQFAI